jgi:hypothetical protein
VLARLYNAGLQANINKYEFYIIETKFLGFIITTEGIIVNPSKVEAITD